MKELANPTPTTTACEIIKGTEPLIANARKLNFERHAFSSFHSAESTLLSPHLRSSHWSVAWSDLMMTMFVLFLSLFIYQVAREQILQPAEPEIVAGVAVKALQLLSPAKQVCRLIQGSLVLP